MDEGVHLGRGHVIGLQLLAVEQDGVGVVVGRQLGHGLAQRVGQLTPVAQLCLDAQAKGAGGRVVEVVTRLRVENVADQMAHVGGREELAGAAAPLGKLADEVLIGAAQQVGLHVVEAQPLLAHDVDQARQDVVVQQALVALTGVEVAPVDDAKQVLVLAAQWRAGCR